MKTLFALSLLLATPAYPADAPKIDPAKPAGVTLSVQDWQAVLVSLSDSSRLSARDANRITQTIISQVQAQIQPGSVKK